MAKILVVLAAAAVCWVGLATARPRYLAVPLEDVQLIELAELEAAPAPANMFPLARLPRRAQLAPARIERSHLGGGGDGGHGDYVDYGAHTGHHGAFGWYADFPVIKHGGY